MHEAAASRVLWRAFDKLEAVWECRVQGTRHASFQLQRESLQRHRQSFSERLARHSLRHTSSTHWPQLYIRTNLDPTHPQGVHCQSPSS